ncbi:MAG: DNA polymerase III subunit gamma/tau [Clostridiales bacterium]|nr:DNA polymerase III subunit gamma/tau [Clostridiales bacterium]MCI1960783.1 DNA polymerase III subunit gamma/tau [Clostridiales bacterium]MCI2021224.1 DNA polymerase III subunit gamma/tau [Clostridiales bacterium]MCI2025607.1 DNA polymerase III subunit gamma/tau [Clostridiales bacterium]
MYQVLYRKWRPRVFSDVVGQPQVTETLKNELKTGRISHAYLFTGSRGTGKTTCAKILAKAVNCLNLKDGDPCGECEICRGISDGTVMDIVEIDAASNNGVDNIRALREEANFTPAAAKYRVYIIDEVHMLSVGAFNALLKTLEEPPAHVIFILATTEVHKLPATILSRCQRFDFRRIPAEDIAKRLQYVTEQEGGSLDPEAGMLLARLADGALRDALSLLDQCLGRSRQITVQVVNETAGLAGREHLFALADAVLNRDSSSALQTIDELYRGGKDMARLCEEFSSHLRGMMLIKTMKNARSILAVTEEEWNLMQEQALKMPLPTLLHGLDVLQETLDKMYRGGDRRIEMEMAMVRLTSPELDDSKSSILRRLDHLEKGKPRKAIVENTEPAADFTSPIAQEAPSKMEKESIPEVLTASSPISEKIKEPPKHKSPVLVKAPTKDSEEIFKNIQPFSEWPEVLEALKTYSRTIAAAFNGSTAYLSGGYVLIDAKNEMAFKLLRESSQRDHMREAIQNITGKVYRLGPYRPSGDSEKAKSEDPLITLAQKAQNAGIEVTEK